MRRMVTTCDAPGCGREFEHEPLEVRLWVGKGRIATRIEELQACSTACVSLVLASFGSEDAQRDVRVAQAKDDVTDRWNAEAVEMLAPAIIGAACSLTKRAVDRLDMERASSRSPNPFDLPGQYERMRCDGKDRP